ncbi:hypothetical protein TNCV_4345731 [Trichonephila clavipes]|nr:hypothetical protein TNCV_4345731 [Trichonephila clavipes]
MPTVTTAVDVGSYGREGDAGIYLKSEIGRRIKIIHSTYHHQKSYLEQTLLYLMSLLGMKPLRHIKLMTISKGSRISGPESKSGSVDELCHITQAHIGGCGSLGYGKTETKNDSNSDCFFAAIPEEPLPRFLCAEYSNLSRTPSLQQS